MEIDSSKLKDFEKQKLRHLQFWIGSSVEGFHQKKERESYCIFNVRYNGLLED